MAEYIEKEAILRHLADVQFGEKTAQMWDGVEDAIQAVIHFPAADVVPVRHGRWIYKPLDKFRKYQVKCTNCDMVFIGNYDAYDEPGDFNFCPNCGCAMDQGG